MRHVTQLLKLIVAGLLVLSIFCGVLVWSTISSRSSVEKHLSTSAPSRPLRKLDKNNQNKNTRKSLSRGEHGSFPEKMTPDKASLLIEQGQSILDLEKRAIYCADIIRRLCDGGYTSEAWELINASPGQVRDYEISAFFENASLNEGELVGKLKLLGSKFEFVNGFSAYFDRYDLQKTRDFVLSSRFNDLIPEVKDRLGANGLSNVLDGILKREAIFSNAEKQRQILDFANELYSKNLIGKNVFLGAYGRDHSSDAFSRWDVVSKLVGDISKDSESSAAVNLVIKDMITSDANRAAISLTAASGDAGLNCFHAGIKEWATLDPTAANKWFMDNENKLPGSQRDAAAASFFKVSLDFGDKAVAKQWLDQIRDPDLRKTALSMFQRK